MKKLFAAVVIVLFLTLPAGVRAAQPPTEPMLRIETGVHTAPFNRIGIDAANRFLVTGSLDKTVRVWELDTGPSKQSKVRLVRVIRPPVGEGNEGAIDAVAISPNGKTIACGGWLGFEWNKSMDIYLFDRASGALVKRITGLPNVINHLSFSKNGQFLVAALVQNSGIRVYRTSDGSLVGQDREYGDDSYGADFDNSGWLVTVSFDGYIRLYDRSFHLLKKTKTLGGRQPYSVRFSPDGSRIAVGFYDPVRVDVLSGQDLSWLFSPDITGVDNGNINNVSWSADGWYLYAGGLYQKKINNDWQTVIRRWSNRGRGGYKDLQVCSQTITHILPLKDGGIVFSAADPALGIIDDSGRRILYKGPATADYRNNEMGFLVSRDGSTVRFGYEVFGKDAAIFSISDRSLKADDDTDYSSLSPPITAFAGVSVTDWGNSYTPCLNGVPLKLKQYEMSRSIAIAPDGKSILLGTDWYLRLFEKRGSEKWNTPLPTVVWDVNISGNGKVAVAALADGTIRWFRMMDGKELLAFFPHRDQKRWVLWTPSGYYAASAGGDELIGWHINRGKDNAADFFPASRFTSTFYRPDVLAKVLTTLDEGEALRLANAQAGMREKQITVSQMLPPVVQIISPIDGARVTRLELTVKVNIRSPSGEPVTAMKALVDGRPVVAERGIGIKAPRTGNVLEMMVRVPERDCEVSIIAENRYAASEPATVRVKWAGAKTQDAFVIKPKLYVLAVGVSNYQDKTLSLGFAAKDAKDFAEAMLKQKGGLYRDVVEKVLTDETATKGNVLDGLEWIQSETTSKDVAMVLIAGHGVNDRSGVYYYLPVNVNIDKLKRTGVMFGDIKNTVEAIAGKTLVFIDTCHSGDVMGRRRGLSDIAGVINELASAENGAVVFASSTGSQYSLENSAWGNGAFTKALVEGVTGKADYTGKGKISVNMLDLYLSERVKELTSGRQTPTTTKPQTVPDFPIAVRR
jgi:WD40 repeat protein